MDGQPPTPAALDSPPEDNRVPAARPPPIPDYELLRRIGSGSYGDVWLARNVLGQFRAVKIIYRHRFTDPRPFEREFEGIQRFEPISRSHPSQLHILHVGKNDDAGCFYYLMELADAVGAVISESVISKPVRSATTDSLNTGSLITDYSPRTLRHDLERQGRLPIADCVQVGISLATALAHLHEQGLVHRDIKPSNIIFVNGVAKLGDIGLVTEAGDTRSIVGTEGYLPPEGPGTPQADLFSLGKVLYEISTGLDRRRFAELPDDLRNWPDHAAVVEFNEIVLRACVKDPAQRYQTAEQLRADLALLQEGKSVQRIRKNQRLWAGAKKAAAGLALLCLLGAGIAVYLRNNKTSGLLAVSRLSDDGTSGTKNVKAAEAYRLGLPALRRGTREGFRQAAQNFTAATEEDPRFVAAYARLIETYLLDEDGGIGFIDGKTEKLASFTAMMEKIAPTHAETHAARAVVKFINEWKWTEAEAEFRQALQLDPNCQMALTYYGYLLTRLGRRNEAESYLNRARQLDPSSPLVTKFLGHCDFLARDFEKALQFYLKASDLEPSYLSSRYWAGRCYLAMTNYSQAIAEFERRDWRTGIGLPEGYHAKLREAFEKDGAVGFWKKTMETRSAMNDDRAKYTHYFQAECHARLGDTNRALDQLEQALVNREGATELVIDEFWDRYRLHPRFQNLLNRAGLPGKQR